MMETKKESTTDMLLLEDGTFSRLPTHIHQAFELLREKRPSKVQILRALIYIVSLESGFHTIDNSESFNNKSGCFNIANVRKNINFIRDLPQDETVLITLALNESHGEYKLFLRETHGAVLITFIYSNILGKSLFVSAYRYVLNSALEDPPKCFFSLKQLSFELKETIFTPVRNQSLESDQESFASLIGLPSEVVWMIFKYLDKKVLKNLSRTCKQMNSEIKNFKSHPSK